jgi:hypothetical protein
MAEDVRAGAAVNTDSTPYGSLQTSGAIQNEKSEHLNHLAGAAGYHYAILRTDHYSFRDFPSFFSPAGPSVVSQRYRATRRPSRGRNVSPSSPTAPAHHRLDRRFGEFLASDRPDRPAEVVQRVPK